MGILELIAAFAKFAPAVTGVVGASSSVQGAANKIADVAQKLTGADTPELALERLKADSALQMKFAEHIDGLQRAELEAQVKSAETVNETIRAELAQSDKFKSYWRPMFGYACAFTWCVQMLACVYAILTKSATDAAAVINAFAGLAVMWGTALAVLGVNVVKRSQDKAIAAGVRSPSMFDFLKRG